MNYLERQNEGVGSMEEKLKAWEVTAIIGGFLIGFLLLFLMIFFLFLKKDPSFVVDSGIAEVLIASIT